ncbi:MAG: hypothetical protein KDD12_26800 [Lewinella sp.]|nr:hypothetical protein [Lewinella sp.]
MKIILRIFKWILLSLLGLITVVFILLLLDRDYRNATLTETEKNAMVAQKAYRPETRDSLYEPLLKEYGQNKKLAEGFEFQCLLALSHYPELKETPIEFLVQPAFLPLSSRPDPVTVLSPWIRRKYLVVISSRSTDYFEQILLKNTPFNEQVGIIGHELGHSVFYLDKSALKLVGIAYNYEYDEDYATQFERETDKRAVAHGLGYQLYDFAFFVRKAFGDSQEKIAAEKGDMYLSPNELAAEMTKYDCYRDTLNPPGHYFTN